MKRTIITFAICLLAVLAYSSLQTKTYTVSLTIDQWQAVINSIDSKSVSSMLEKQLIPQLQDTTKAKKP